MNRASLPDEGRRRVVVEGLAPDIECGRFPIKRVVGERVDVEVDAFADGHDAVVVHLLWQGDGESAWHRAEMAPHVHGNDRWVGTFAVTRMGRARYTVEAWVDRLRTWTRDLERWVEAGQAIEVDLRIGADLLRGAATRAAADPNDAQRLQAAAERLEDASVPEDERAREALDPALRAVAARHPDVAWRSRLDPPREVVVDRERARFSTWYELFPRSTAPLAGQHGTFRDVIARLPYVAGLGFDVLYLPPIHPIGTAFRKGPNNALSAGPGDPGVPWAIGAVEGGHTAVHPELGTLDDFRALVDAAHGLGVELALDIAFQASPDHPWVREHVSWFRARPDGTIQYAENPPKKYQDIYPFDFESEDWQGLWQGLHDVMAFWASEGVRVFRVDNPHTKAFPFWEWAITRLKAAYPDLLFLAEAFTRPKVMYRLAKLGFSQSYTYFTWRTAKGELADYFRELSTPPVRDFFRPNVWPNTPDILHETLQMGGRGMFEARVILAATLSATYGIYGPAYELLEATPREPGSEEYLDSEKYQVRHWELDHPGSIAPLIGRLNAIRREHPALQSNDRLRFHEVDDDMLLCYSKRTEDRSDVVLTLVSLDPDAARRGTVRLDLEELGLDPSRPFEAHDLLSGRTRLWQGAEGRVELVPGTAQAEILVLHPLRAEARSGADG
jgi:starch synthase (maltosyl-transferring)